MRKVLGVVGAVVGIYGVVCAGAFAMQRQIIYQPFGTNPLPIEAGLPEFELVGIDTADGERIAAYWKAPESGRATIVYFHGNGGAASHRAPRALGLSTGGRGVLLLEYRGYPGSTGTPSEEGMANDADAARAFVEARTKGAVVLYGESLGSGVATGSAARSAPAALILDAPFTSMTDVAKERMPWLPVDLLLRDRFDTASRIGNIPASILILHGTADRVVPHTMGEALRYLVPGRIKLVLLPGADHVSNLETAAGREAVAAMLRQVENGR